MDITSAVRKSWKIESLVSVFVVSRNKWYEAKVVDEDGDFLTVSIQNKIYFELSRFDEQLRRHLTEEEIEAARNENDRIKREQQQKAEEERMNAERNRLQTIFNRPSEFNKMTNVNEGDEDIKNEESDSDLSTDYYTSSDEESTSHSSSLSLELSDDEEQGHGNYSDDEKVIFVTQKRFTLYTIFLFLRRMMPH